LQHLLVTQATGAVLHDDFTVTIEAKHKGKVHASSILTVIRKLFSAQTFPAHRRFLNHLEHFVDGVGSGSILRVNA
jgi:hypothetical protein